MQRKELDAILIEDFITFLKQSDLYSKFQEGKLLCSFCNEPITLENIFAVINNDGIKFCCNKSNCMELFRKG